MEKICVKCGYTHTIENINLQAECPKCGVFYAKVEAIIESTEQEKKPGVD